jgi:hypothetical protein
MNNDGRRPEDINHDNGTIYKKGGVRKKRNELNIDAHGEKVSYLPAHFKKWKSFPSQKSLAFLKKYVMDKTILFFAAYLIIKFLYFHKRFF